MGNYNYEGVELDDLGEFYNQGVGGRNEDWFNLLRDPKTGDLYILRDYSHMSGLTINSGQSIKPIEEWKDSYFSNAYPKAMEYWDTLKEQYN